MEHLLRPLAEAWGQQGVSIWVKRGKETRLLGFWHESDNFNVHDQEPECTFEYNEWVIRFYGSPSMDISLFKRFMPVLAPWLGEWENQVLRKKQEESLNSLVQVAHTIVSSMQSDRVLDLILEAAIDTMSAADTGFLFLYDGKIDKLVVRSAIGFRRESYTLTRLSPGEGVSGIVFQTGEPVRITGSDNISAAMNTMSEQNLQYYIDSTVDKVYPLSMMSVPLIYQDRKIGVLTIDNFHNPTPFTDWDLKILQAFADLAAVVIAHHQLFQQFQRQNRELSLTHQALQKEHERLQKTMDFHNQLTNIAAKGHGLQPILAALHQATGSPVAIYDSILAPVAQYPADFSFRLPDNFFLHPSMKLVNQTSKWQRVDLDDQTIIVTPIIGTDRLLGYLFAWTDPQKFADIGKLVFEYSATVIALEWIKKEAIRESQERMKGQFLEDILAGRMSTRLMERARYLGLRKDGYYAVMMAQAAATDKKPSSERIAYVDRLLEQSGVGRLVISQPRFVVIILHFPDNFNREQRVYAIRRLMHQLQAARDIQVAIGRIKHGLEQVGRSYKDAQQCLELFERHRHLENTLYFSDLGIVRFFLQHDRNELQSYLQEVLEPIFHYDKKRNGVFLQTLLAYVEYDKDLGSTTKRLNIHYNTLYYRINRIQEILGCSFDQEEEWFSVKLACHIYRFLERQRDADSETEDRHVH